MVWTLVTQLIGGLGLFLFGMQLMASGLQKAAGDRLRRILEILTNKPVIAVLTGIVVTVLVQSSSTTTVMVVGFANAGLMTLPQAVGTILGANIGTTVTAQIVSFKVSALVFPAIGLGAVLNFFGKRRTYKYVGQAILGFGILFLGMTTMSDGMKPLRELPYFMNLMASFGHNPLMGVLIGAVFTALVQSSSASTGLIIAMTLQDILILPAAIALILGTNVGTCITALIASVGTSLAAKRAAIAHIAFNVCGVIVAMILFRPFVNFVADTAATVTRQAANAHTIFNITSTLVVLPFFKYFVALVTRLVPGEDVTLEMGPKFLDKRILKTPAVAIGGVRQECLRMAGLAREMVQDSLQVFIKEDRKLMQYVEQKEELLDSLEKEITIYLAELAQHSLTIEQSQSVSGLMHAANDLERIGDHATNIVRMAEIKIEDRLPFSEKAAEELTEMFDRVDDMLAKAIEAFAKEDLSLAKEVIAQDDIVDRMERVLRKSHIARISEKVCFPASGVIYLDVLSNLERIADHATNFAQVVLGEF
ncbi:MAG: Na/Pi cotransporter family protein [Clostridiales bacterium]|jgi:phosphate:Na+ symporter|nr:Na/Pi cotransporter family protein [Clostridiales bacterium]